MAVRFLQHKIKSTRLSTEKLRERNATLHRNITKTEATLEIKKDLSDVLHAVDFDQLAIQKQQLESRLRDRDKEVFRLKGENLKTEKVSTWLSLCYQRNWACQFCYGLQQYHGIYL